MTYYVWMFQVSLKTYPPPITIELLRTNPTLLVVSIILFVLVFLSSIIIIRSSIIYRKNSINFQKLKKHLLLFSILITLSTFAWIIMMEAYYIIYDSNHWIGIGLGHYIPYFGVIGPFIGLGFIVLGVLLERNSQINKTT